jgi:hypothetical protein
MGASRTESALITSSHCIVPRAAWDKSACGGRWTSIPGRTRGARSLGADAESPAGTGLHRVGRGGGAGVARGTLRARSLVAQAVRALLAGEVSRDRLVRTRAAHRTRVAVRVSLAGVVAVRALLDDATSRLTRKPARAQRNMSRRRTPPQCWKSWTGTQTPRRTRSSSPGCQRSSCPPDTR